MSKSTKSTARQDYPAPAYVLSQTDADRFEKAASDWGRSETRSKKKATDKLVALGIATKKGKLTKRYG